MQGLEKLSHEHPHALLQQGGLLAVRFGAAMAATTCSTCASVDVETRLVSLCTCTCCLWLAGPAPTAAIAAWLYVLDSAF